MFAVETGWREAETGLRMTGPSWMVVGPRAAVALSACLVATALPGSGLWAEAASASFVPARRFIVEEIWVKRWYHSIPGDGTAS